MKTSPQTWLYPILYLGGALLLGFDLFFLVRALFASNFVPILPTLVGILTALGLLLVIYAEHAGRQSSRQEARRISRVAHQLESPLKSLETDLTALLEQASKLPPEARLRLKTMATKSRVLLNNVRDVFLMLQGEDRSLHLELRAYDICHLVQEVIDAQDQQAQAKNVELSYQLHCETAPVKVNRQYFRIALSHLIENAITYTLTPGRVVVHVKAASSKVRIVVQDRGIGISDTDLPIIFQPFARGERAHEFDPDGIGTGLTLTKSLIQAMNGELRYHNRSRGMGSEFEINLPLAGATRGN